AARPLAVLEGEGRQLFFVGAPAELRGGRALLAKALDAPGVDEFANVLGYVRHLRVALAAMDDLDAELVRKMIEGKIPGMLGDELGLGAGELLVCQRLPGDV